MTDREIDVVLNRWCVELLTATSPPAVLERVRRDIQRGEPVYDVIKPRLLRCCGGCGQDVTWSGRGRPWCVACRQARRVAA